MAAPAALEFSKLVAASSRRYLATPYIKNLRGWCHRRVEEEAKAMRGLAGCDGLKMVHVICSLLVCTRSSGRTKSRVDGRERWDC